jgi:hypothetical protein
LRALQACGSGCSWDAENAPAPRWAYWPQSAFSTSITSFLNRPSPGRESPWQHPPGSARWRLGGAGGGQRAALAGDRPDLGLLDDALCAMSWHTPRRPWLTASLADVCFLAGFRGAVTWPRSVWRLPVALGPRVSNALLSVRVHTPVTRCSLRLWTRAGRPMRGDPISTTACCAGPAMQRVASPSAQVQRCLRNARLLTPLAVPRLPVRPPSRGSATGP